MNTPIKIDLSCLTQAMIDEAMPNQGVCSYSSPCIIGALMKPEDRSSLRDQGVDGTGIKYLESDGLVEFTDPDQKKTAMLIQEAFDGASNGMIDSFSPKRLENLLKKINPNLHI